MSESTPRPLVVEAAINGGITTRADNPHVAYTARDVATDAAAALTAGASIVHYHVREADGGRITDYDRLLGQHVEAIESIRAQTAPLLWNTFPVGGDCATRFRLFRDLSARPGTRPDVGAHDIGSLNIVSTDSASGRVSSTSYINTFDDVRYFLEGFRDLGLRPFLNIFEPGFIRTALVCLELGLLEEPLIFKFYFSDQFGLPLCERSIEAYLELVGDVRHEWFGCHIGGDVIPYAGVIASLGGHLRVGLEDDDDASRGQRSNAQLVADAISGARGSGRPLATVDDAARILALR